MGTVLHVQHSRYQVRVHQAAASLPSPHGHSAIPVCSNEAESMDWVNKTEQFTQIERLYIRHQPYRDRGDLEMMKSPEHVGDNL